MEDNNAHSSFSNQQRIDQMNNLKQEYGSKLQHLIEENKKHRLREKKLQENIDYLTEKLENRHQERQQIQN